MVDSAANSMLTHSTDVVGQVGNPSGEALLNVEKQAKEALGGGEAKKKSDSEKPGGERIGGNAQTAQNPLGL